MQKRKTKTGQAAENSKKYKYEDQLQFLLPYSNDRDTLTNVPLQETSALTEQIDAIEEAPPEEPNDAETNQPQTSSSVAGRIFRGRSKVGRSQNTATPPDTPSALLMKYILDKNDPENVTQVPPHDIDTFLAGIASTMKKLNPYNQHIAKGRIFNVVHELESQELFSQPPYVPNVSSQHSQNCSNTNSPSTSLASMNNNSLDSGSPRSLHNLDASRHSVQPLIQQPAVADDISLREYFNKYS